MKTLRFSLLGALLVFSVGCFQPPAQPTATETSPAAPPAPITTAAEATPRETLNQTTQNVLDLEKALADGGVLAATNVPATDPMSQSAAAYRTTVGKLGAMAVHQAIQIRDAQSINDPKPLSYEQFMTEIIKKDQPDGIQLAMLPYYQEYAWDANGQKLVVVDFPARQEARRKQLDNN